MPGAADAVPVLITRQIPVPAAEVNLRLSQDPAAFLGAPDPTLLGPDGRHLVPLEVRLAGVRFDRTAAIGFGPAIEEDDGTRTLPLWWEAAEQPWLFPTFAGGLKVRPYGEGSVLRLEGRYRPPLGGRTTRQPGRAQPGCHGVARDTPRSALDRLALDRLSSGLTGG